NLIGAGYRSWFGRDPEPAAQAWWQAQMAGGLGEEQFTARVLASPEYYGRHGGDPAAWVAGLYQDVLGRAPDAARLAFWTSRLQGGASPLPVAQGLLASPEADTLAVSADYQHLLGRPPEDQGLQVWIGALESGLSQGQLTAGITSTPEFIQRLSSGDVGL